MPITVSESGEWVERLAISDLICRYSSAVTRADWEETEALFAPDAIWEIPALGLRHEGGTAIRYFLAETIRYDVLLQTAHSPVIRLLGPGQGQATTTIHELVRGEVLADSAFARAGTPVNIEQYGIYHDDVAQLDGDWRFTHRIFVPVYVQDNGVSGQVVTPRSALPADKSGVTFTS